ncbi:hypothetical protein LXEBMM8_EKPBGFGD_00832 [Lactiplantibacillus xiangfangensis]
MDYQGQRDFLSVLQSGVDELHELNRTLKAIEGSQKHESNKSSDVDASEIQKSLKKGFNDLKELL